MKDILGEAVHNYHFNNTPGKLWIHNTYGPKEPMPVEAYFREEDDMPDLEWVALNECRGQVLDVGAGAGSHALILQERGFEVMALDISANSVEVMKLRGVKQAVQADIFTYSGHQFDTILLLMNGIGLAGTLSGLTQLLQHLKTLLQPGGQLLFDSSDVAYLYEGKVPAGEPYYGEISYQYEYKNQKTEWFKWLYIDEKRLTAIVEADGWDMDVLYEDEHGQYLTRLTLKK
ncbi:class I SAM-dependent methyltransferase [Mucilaginibacter sp. Bleaf8]|uniref:class I SAM-dependent methyltransferase n=1 Tax=Mucilaginibacter sp. Bleaf8 TaxID=2834430 RepID=UPI001BCC5B9A|nr:class I SAM-dependent methyltransferase [Mucilaginibacter sp. Bleaf8]MBS7563220.1 class I SAM-dependent methyltransferase [Mucilaginibacter sp. Bleaf8]